MRRVLRRGIAFCLALALCCALAGAGQAAGYTLPEKMAKQLQIGSGLRGSFTVAYTAGDEAEDFWQLVNGAEFQVRGIASGGQLHYYVYQTEADGETPRARTDLLARDQAFYLSSDMLPGRVYSMPDLAGLADFFATRDQKGGNPSLASALVRIAAEAPGRDGNAASWQAMLEKYAAQAEVWLSRFPVATNYTEREGFPSALELSYTIPVSALKDGIVEWVQTASQDQELRALLSGVMTQEQMDLYLNPNLAYFYQAALDRLLLNDEVTLSKITSARTGEFLASVIDVPLDEKITGFSALTVESGVERTQVSLQGEAWTVLMDLPADFSLEAPFGHTVWFARYRTDDQADQEGEGEEPNLALRIEFSGVESTETVEEGVRTLESKQYSCLIARDTSFLPEEDDPARFAPFEDWAFTADLLFSGKNLNQSPTTLTFDLLSRRQETELRLTGSVKTASSWIFSPFAVENPIDLTALSADDLQSLGDEWMQKAGELIQPTVPE